ncbi:hypothetical protein AAMO2058_000788300 [Amorphochlora amoebiformis]
MYPGVEENKDGPWQQNRGDEVELGEKASVETKQLNRDDTIGNSDVKLEVAEDPRINIMVHGSDFKDTAGRTVLLRGINVAGTSKLPINSPNTHTLEGFHDNTRDVSFVGRPFPLSEAPQHFRRLRCWGFNYIRLVITWEAVEHAGPGIYDRKYLEYLTKLVRIAKDFGINVYVDPHQDVWSRFTGGCGAPAWTLDLVGFDISALSTVGAAVTMQEYNPSSAHFPLMLWPTNNFKHACATMFTLFWSGNDFAPNLRVGDSAYRIIKKHNPSSLDNKNTKKFKKNSKKDSDPSENPPKNSKTVTETVTETVSSPPVIESQPLLEGKRGGGGERGTEKGGGRKKGLKSAKVQDFLQNCYISAMRQVALALKDEENVLGFGTMNEPHHGYHGLADLNQVYGTLKKGVYPTPFQSFALAEGHPIRVREFIPGCCAYVCGYATSSMVLNPGRRRGWMKGRKCVWRMHGVWDITGGDIPVLKKPGYFNNGKDWSKAYFLPFAKKYSHMLHKINPQWHVYLELPPAGVAPEVKFPKLLKSYGIRNAVNATHWYDGFSLFSATPRIQFNIDVETKLPKFGAAAVQSMFNGQVESIKNEGLVHFEGGAPCVIGEFGIPFNGVRKNFGEVNDSMYANHTKLLDMNFKAMEVNKVHYALWNYTPNNNTKYGDQWNFEDLSVYSLSHKVREHEVEPPVVELKEIYKSKLQGTYKPSDQKAARSSLLYNGGRTLDAVCRPFARATAGSILKSRYDMARRRYILSFKRNPAITYPTEVFVPLWAFPLGFTVSVNDGEFTVSNCKDNFVIISYTTPAKTSIFQLTVEKI